MLLGPGRILTCPYCGNKKIVLSLNSGNTLDATLWSDNKQIAPMLPRISPVQKCIDDNFHYISKGCGKYYFVSRQSEVYGGMSHNKGTLSFLEVKEAFAQLMEENLTQQEQSELRLLYHYAYNDFYVRERFPMKITKIDKKDKQMFHDNALWLIDNFLKDDILKAEYYREIGNFEAAKTTIEKVDPKTEFLSEFVARIKERIDKKESEVFIVKGGGSTRPKHNEQQYFQIINHSLIPIPKPK